MLTSKNVFIRYCNIRTRGRVSIGARGHYWTTKSSLSPYNVIKAHLRQWNWSRIPLLQFNNFILFQISISPSNSQWWKFMSVYILRLLPIKFLSKSKSLRKSREICMLCWSTPSIGLYLIAIPEYGKKVFHVKVCICNRIDNCYHIILNSILILNWRKCKARHNCHILSWLLI